MDDRLMPRPWFRASSHSFSMGTILFTEGSFGRRGPLREGERRQGWMILPPFQRPPVWTVAQQVRFIESAWSGMPLGAWVYNRTLEMDAEQDGWLLDGQQRVGAVLAYVADAFPVCGYLWSQLPRVDQRMFELISFPALETHLDSTPACLEVYDRLAYGGTPHEPKEAPRG